MSRCYEKGDRTGNRCTRVVGSWTVAGGVGRKRVSREIGQRVYLFLLFVTFFLIFFDTHRLLCAPLRKGKGVGMWGG